MGKKKSTRKPTETQGLTLADLTFAWKAGDRLDEREYHMTGQQVALLLECARREIPSGDWGLLTDPGRMCSRVEGVSQLLLAIPEADPPMGEDHRLYVLESVLDVTSARLKAPLENWEKRAAETQVHVNAPAA
jgi:hypothetical protein